VLEHNHWVSRLAFFGFTHFLLGCFQDVLRNFSESTNKQLIYFISGKFMLHDCQPNQKEHLGIERRLGARASQSRTERARQLTSARPAATSRPRGGKESKQFLNKK
jgi:hypothetical protein